MDTRHILIINSLICFWMSFIIYRVVKKRVPVPWTIGFTEIIIAGLLVSGISTFAIAFMPEQEIFYWSNMEELMEGTLVILIWNLIFSISFLLSIQSGIKIGAKISNSFVSSIGLTVIGSYVLVALLLSFLFKVGVYKEGFGAFTKERVVSMGDFQTALIRIPSKIWTVGLGLLLVKSYHTHKKHIQKLGYAVVVIIFLITTSQYATFGLRGFAIKILAFFWIILRSLRLKKLSWIILGIFIISGVLYFSTIAQYRAEQARLEQQKPVWIRITEIIKLGKESPVKARFSESFYYLVFRVSPAQPGIFVNWIKQNRAYAGFHPLLGALFGFLPRVVWPNKPMAGSLSQSLYETPAFLTARIAGAPPQVQFGTSPASDAFWLFGYFAVVLAAGIAGWFSALIMGIGKKDLRMGILLIAVGIAYGGAFLNFGIKNILLMSTQILLPLFLILKIFKINKLNK